MKKTILVVLITLMLSFFACFEESGDGLHEDTDGPDVVEVTIDVIEEDGVTLFKDLPEVDINSAASLPTPQCPCEKGESLIRWTTPGPQGHVVNKCVSTNSQQYQRMLSRGAIVCCKGGSALTCENGGACIPFLCSRPTDN